MESQVRKTEKLVYFTWLPFFYVKSMSYAFDSHKEKFIFFH